MARTALLLGATGLIGGFCLDALLQDPAWDRVRVLVRRPFERKHPKLEVLVRDLSFPERLGDDARCDDLFSCIGTTRAKTADPEQYRRIDYGIPVRTAKAALEEGAQRLLLVSSAGADSRSRFFYPRLKGEIDDAVTSLPFQAVHVFRPSLLLGERSERRTGEAWMIRLAPFYSWIFSGPLRSSRPIQASAVGRAMVRAAGSEARGVHIHEYDSIVAWAGGN